MGCEHDCYDEPASPTTPKLSLFSLPSKQQRPDLSTPPIHTLASVPFKWEEAPGKPRPSCIDEHHLPHDDPKSKTTARCLDLPPRLLNEAGKVNNNNNIASPTTVLDGPYLGSHKTQSLYRSRSLSFAKGKSFRELEKLGRRGNNKGGVIFGSSSRWGSFRRNNKEVVDDGGVDFSSASVFDGGDHGNVDSKVKITRIKRKSSFLISFSSSSTSHLLTNIYEGFKQVVPWRRSQRG